MKKILSALAACVLGLVFFPGCSSAPDAPEEVFEKRNQAARNLESGNRYFKDALYDQALEFYGFALDSYTALDDIEGRITACNSIGKVFFLAGELETAMTNYSEAFALAEGPGASLGPVSRPILLLQSANNIGEVHIRRGEDAEALETFRKTLNIQGVQNSDSVELAVLYHNMGVVLRNQGDFAAAVTQAQKAADMNRKAKRFEELAANYYLLASIYFRQDKLAEAQANAETALEYDKKMENSLGIAQDLLALGAIAEKAGKTAEAHDIYKRSFLVYRSLRYVPGMIRCLEKLITGAETLNLKEETERYREAYAQLQTKGP